MPSEMLHGTKSLHRPEYRVVRGSAVTIRRSSMMVCVLMLKCLCNMVVLVVMMEILLVMMRVKIGTVLVMVVVLVRLLAIMISSVPDMPLWACAGLHTH